MSAHQKFINVTYLTAAAAFTAVALASAAAVHAGTIGIGTIYGSGSSGTTALTAYPYLNSSSSYTVTGDVTQGGLAGDWRIFSATGSTTGGSYNPLNAAWDSTPAGGKESISDLTVTGGSTLSTWQSSGSGWTNSVGLSYSGATSTGSGSPSPTVPSGTSSIYVYNNNSSNSTYGAEGEQFTQTMFANAETITIYTLAYTGTDVGTQAAGVLNASVGTTAIAPTTLDVAQLYEAVSGHYAGFFTIDVSGAVGDTVTISYASPAGTGGNNGVYAASVVATPEPATLALMATVGVGILLLGRRHRRAYS